MVTHTKGGRVHVRWDETAQATPHVQVVFFAEFLAMAGMFDRWVQGGRRAADAPTHRGRATCWACRCLASWLEPSAERTSAGCAALARGDCGYGNEDIIDVSELRDLPYPAKRGGWQGIAAGPLTSECPDGATARWPSPAFALADAEAG
jgi:hypothetical protein